MRGRRWRSPASAAAVRARSPTTRTPAAPSDRDRHQRQGRARARWSFHFQAGSSSFQTDGDGIRREEGEEEVKDRYEMLHSRTCPNAVIGGARGYALATSQIHGFCINDISIFCEEQR